MVQWFPACSRPFGGYVLSLNIKAFCLGPLANNGYLIWDEDSKEAFAVDPPMDAELMASFAARSDLRVTKILNTHGHFDHIAGNALMKKFSGAGVFIHKADLGLLKRGAAHAEMFGLEMDPSPPPDGFLKEGDELILGSGKIMVLETPGHTPGGVSFYTEGDLFSGDSLFEGSIGRTDLEGGDLDSLVDSIRTKLFALPPETLVHPGHGPETTIGREMGGNPFVGGSAARRRDQP